MTPSKNRQRVARDANDHQAVGYGRPPIGGRFKPGQSGNPKGRRKGSKTVAQSIDETLMRKVTIEEDGRRVILTLQELILRNLGYAAARRDMTAIKILFALKDRYQDSSETKLDPTELDPNDRAIIEGYIETLKAAATTSDPKSSETTGPDEAVPGERFKPDHNQLDKKDS